MDRSCNQLRIVLRQRTHNTKPHRTIAAVVHKRIRSPRVIFGRRRYPCLGAGLRASGNIFIAVLSRLCDDYRWRMDRFIFHSRRRRDLRITLVTRRGAPVVAIFKR